MLDFLKILLFYKVTFLGQYDVNSSLEIDTRNKEVAALMPSAYLSLELSSQDGSGNDLKLTERLDRGAEIIRECECKAVIVLDGRKFLLDRIYPSTSDEKIYINFSSEDGLPIDVSATSIKIQSKVPMDNVLVSWHNLKK